MDHAEAVYSAPPDTLAGENGAVFNVYLETNYLIIYWTDLYQIFRCSL